MKIVGLITEDEKQSIREINSRKVALEELLLILQKDDELYLQVSQDLQETMIKYQEWWDINYHKYQWEKGAGNWKIMFDTNEVIIEE